MREIETAAPARVVAALLAEPGDEVFRYRPEDRRAWVNIRRRHINAYLSEMNGARFTAKDFRTWAGTLYGACALARCGYPRPPPRALSVAGWRSAMRETSELLGQHAGGLPRFLRRPDVVLAFAKGRVLADPPPVSLLQRGSARTLLAVERRLVRLIGNGDGRAPGSLRQ